MVKDHPLKALLDSKVQQYNRREFIKDDPLGIPHRFTKPQDIEIAGFFAAILAWGNRKSIIRSCEKLLLAMDNAPYEFVMNSAPLERRQFAGLEKFVHRTFNEFDLFHLLNFLNHHYRQEAQPSLETAFTRWMSPADETVEQALAGFHEYVFGFDTEAANESHCRKHIATPAKKSACKRLNMYLRWMVRNDDSGVDFGIWKKIKASQLVCPMDVHVARVAKRFRLVTRTQTDWKAAMELTRHLRSLDPSDPVKYDFALFGLGVVEHY